MAKERESIFTDNIHICQDWSHITSEFDSFPMPIIRRDEGYLVQEGWVFRGHKREDYPLQPSIERGYPYSEWAEAEYRILREFQSKAPLHMEPTLLQPTTHEHMLGWLSTMQHYGAPTRLLDFTYSPYLALYFALRNREENESEYAEVWGIDADALMRRAHQVSREAYDKVRERRGLPKPRGGKASFASEDADSSLEAAQREEAHLKDLVRDALSPCGTRREHYNRNGFVAVAQSTTQNARLASQQGVFLFNGALGKPFEESLKLMMENVRVPWYKRFQVPAAKLTKIEEKLFQFNIHELSLFPDTEGLAGFVKQKLRQQFQ